MKLQQGQEVYYVPSSRRGSPSVCTIAKVARKWVYLEPERYGRFDKETLRVDGQGYSSPATIYYSKEDYDSKVIADNYWRKNLGDSLRGLYHRPSHITIDDIDVIRGMLFPST